MNACKMSTVGRPRKSLVWNYYKYEKDSDKSVCQVSIEKEGKPVKCRKELKGTFTSNMKKHLRLHHKETFKKFEQEENERQKAEVLRRRKDSTLVSSSQQTIKEALKPSLYPKDSKKQLAITKKLGLFIGATNVPLSLVDCPEFRDLLKEMDKQYDIPGRKKLGKDIEIVYTKLKKNISLVLENAKRISLCSDIWSKQGMMGSFLGVTAHCFTFLDKKCHSITLAVRRFESPHTGRRIAALLQTIVDEWNMQHKIFRSLTDNGSNMIKAFRQFHEMELEDDSSDVSVDECMDSEDNGDCDNVDSDSEKENDIDEIPTEDEIKEFQQCEKDHRQAFSKWKRNSGFVHTLQLVVKEFKKNPCFKSAVVQAQKIVLKVNKSCKATEMLVKLAGKKLVSNCPTRWDSMFLMIERLVLLMSILY